MGGWTLTERARIRLKHPLGRLVAGTPAETTRVLKMIVEREAPPRIVAVGDAITAHLQAHGVRIDVAIIDKTVMRRPVAPVVVDDADTVQVTNPAGTITPQAYQAVQAILRGSRRSRVVVRGEEDLLALPAIKFAPKGSLVVYGQPLVGIVVVRVTEGVKDEVDALLAEMRGPPRGEKA
jgi:uncharacterized protein (UPF0218 family)